MNRFWWRGAIAASVAWMYGSAAGGLSAHPAFFTAAHATVAPDGSYQIALQFDLLAFVLNDTSARIGNEPMEALLNGPREDLARTLADARERLARGFAVLTDHGEAAALSVDFPTADEVENWRDTAQPLLPVVLPVKLRGRLPSGAGTLAVRFPSVLGDLALTVERPGEDFYMEGLGAGKASTAIPVRLSAAAAWPAWLRACGGKDGGWTALAAAGGETIFPGPLGLAAHTLAGAARRWF